MSAIDHVLRNWRAAAVALNEGAAESDLAQLQRALGTDLPQDVRYYFSSTDGMERYAPGGWLTHFWSIRQIVSDSWINQGTDGFGAYRDLAFVDVMLNAWGVFFRVRPGSGLSIYVEGAQLELPSLEAFFQLYLDDPDALCM